MRNFPTLKEVLAIHRALIEEFGGTLELRDQGALEAAIMRPQLGYYQGMLEEAAALMESLGRNHPFLDGNKRVAFFVTDTFLRMNGYFIECDEEEANQKFQSMFEQGNFLFDELLAWLRDKVCPLSE